MKLKGIEYVKTETEVGKSKWKIHKCQARESEKFINTNQINVTEMQYLYNYSKSAILNCHYTHAIWTDQSMRQPDTGMNSLKPDM